MKAWDKLRRKVSLYIWKSLLYVKIWMVVFPLFVQSNFNTRWYFSFLEQKQQALRYFNIQNFLIKCFLEIGIWFRIYSLNVIFFFSKELKKTLKGA